MAERPLRARFWRQVAIWSSFFNVRWLYKFAAVRYARWRDSAEGEEWRRG